MKHLLQYVIVHGLLETLKRQEWPQSQQDLKDDSCSYNEDDFISTTSSADNDDDVDDVVVEVGSGPRYNEDDSHQAALVSFRGGQEGNLLKL